MDSVNCGEYSRESKPGWAEKVTASNSVRSVYLSLTTHLIIAIILTLWAITPESQSDRRLSPVVIDFRHRAREGMGRDQRRR